ncbi:hypothetical protein OsI_33655 [Oryza sativa Indica Group]|uniref:Uncharacterized protein n=1 Tax=Oryza sativa subsp. indica TaxID=39946 RepID=A2Z7H3_ORYSI|nr:hypothetical protein OsI_33655 [Oryza sativa Indica Group]
METMRDAAGGMYAPKRRWAGWRVESEATPRRRRRWRWRRRQRPTLEEVESRRAEAAPALEVEPRGAEAAARWRQRRGGGEGRRWRRRAETAARWRRRRRPDAMDSEADVCRRGAGGGWSRSGYVRG